MSYIGSSPTKVVSRQSANIFTYTATANQTAFTGADANGNTLACSPSDIMVHINGLKMEKSDFSATSTSVTLVSGAAAGDEVTITAFLTFESADHYTKSAADTRYVNVTGDTMSGNLAVKATLKTTHADADVVQFGGTGYLANWEDAETYLAENLYVNSSGGYRYLTNSHASLYSQTTGKHQFKVAPSGSADGTPTLTTGLEIDNSGRVTKPNNISFKAHQTASGWQSFGGTNETLLPFNTTQHNVGNHWSTSNYRFTAPVAGRYLFTGQLYHDANTYFQYRIRVNGSTYVFVNNRTQGTTAVGTVILQLSVNDYVDVTGKISNSDADDWYSDPSYSFICGYLLG